MATITGLGTPFAPGTEEYKRVEFELSKDKYYKPTKTALLMVGGFGDVPGAKETNDQRKARISLESKEVEQMEFEILTHDPRLTLETTLVTGTLTTGTYGSTNTLTVADASILRAGDIVKNMTTNEYLYVTATDVGASPDEITVYPAFQQTGFTGLTAFPWSLSNATPQTKTNGDVIRIVATAASTGSTSGSIIDSRPTASVNYIEIFREDYGLTWEEEQTKRNGRMAFEDKEERAKGNLLVKLERALVEGAINKQADASGNIIYSTQGVEGTVTSVAASALVGGGNDITRAKLDEIASLIQDANMGGRITCLCGSVFIRKIQEVMKDLVETNVVVGDETFGLKATTYENNFLPIDFVRHEIYDQSGKTDEALFFDAQHLELCHLKNGQMGKVSEKKGIPSGNLVANDKMAIQDAIYGAYGLEYRFMADSARLVTGLSHTIAG